MISFDGRKPWPGTLKTSARADQVLHDPSKPMKAISLWQPWATLMALNFKKVETRIWETKYRGPLAIHAAQRVPFTFLGASRYSLEFQQELASVLGCRLEQLPAVVNDMPRGAVLCIVNLTHIETASTVDYDIPL